MTEPSSVDTVMGWLGELWHSWVPRLPFRGLWSRFTALWQRPVKTPLPGPHEPLPWTIDVEGSWDVDLPGTSLSIDNIRIRVNTTALPGANTKGR
jgi:hypothetical protein